MSRFIWTLLLAFSVNLSWAGTFVCSKTYPPNNSAVDRAEKTNKPRKIYYPITWADVTQGYSGKPVLINNAWLTVVLLPANSYNTMDAYTELDLDVDLASKVIQSSKYVDVGIRTVQNETQLLTTVSDNPPAVGYSSLYVGKNGPPPCFP